MERAEVRRVDAVRVAGAEEVPVGDERDDVVGAAAAGLGRVDGGAAERVPGHAVLVEVLPVPAPAAVRARAVDADAGSACGSDASSRGWPTTTHSARA